MSHIGLENGPTSMQIELRGAYIQTLRVADTDLIFPAQMIGEKLRGGIPVCAPVFGPGDSVGLKQHGFARDIEWGVVTKSKNEVKLAPVNNSSWVENLPEAYSGCDMSLCIQLSKDELTVNLGVTNNGTQPLKCSPGFHPYFATADATKVTMQSQEQQSFTAEQLAATQFLPPGQNQLVMHLARFTVTLASDTLQQYAVWSANPDQYICVEPTLGGYLEHQQSVPLINPGQANSYEMTLSWEERT